MGSVFSKKKTRNMLPTAFVFLHYFSIFFQHYAIMQVGRIVQLNSHCLHFDKKIGFVSVLVIKGVRRKEPLFFLQFLYVYNAIKLFWIYFHHKISLSVVCLNF